MTHMTLQAVRQLIANDSYAITFQSIEQYRAKLLRHFDNLTEGPSTTQPVAAPGALEDLLPPLGIRNDRDMLNYLMTAFDNEIGTCGSCGRSEPTKHMDSADFLRDYLAAAPSGPDTSEAPKGGA